MANGDRVARLDLGEDLVYELALDAQPADVFGRWTDPDQLVTWMGRTAALDPRPGGSFRLEYGNGDVAAGSYLRVASPRSVAFTWGWQGDEGFPPGSTTIEVELEATPVGGTLLRLRHEGVPAAIRANVDEGWGYFLPRLIEAVRTA